MEARQYGYAPEEPPDELAQAYDFRRVVLCRRKWLPEMLEELERASRQSGIELVAATVPSRLSDDWPVVNPLYALPRPLPPRTIYVLFSRMAETPLSYFMHNKVWTGRWLPESLQAHPSANGLLAPIPTYDRLVVPELGADPRWPNLVIKLAELDQTRGVLMGRFHDEREAREALQLGDEPGAVPGVFGARGRGCTVVYQPFIPPEVVDGRALKIRMLVFLSPLANTFLSAHKVHAARELPEALPIGLVPDPKGYAVSHAGGGRYERPDPPLERQLQLVGAEFGRLAHSAIGQRFEAGDVPPGSAPLEVGFASGASQSLGAG